MKTKKIILVSSLLVISTVAVELAASPQQRFKRQHQPMQKIAMLADELALTEEQLTKIQEKQFATAKTAIDTRSKIQVAELELRKLMHDKAADETKIKNKIKEIGALKTELRLNLVEGRLAVKKVLTDEQLEKLQSIRKDRAKNRMNRRGRQFRHPGHRGNFRGNRGGFGFGEFGPESSEIDDEEVVEQGSEI